MDISWFIGESLAIRSLQCQRCALLIVNTQRDAVVVAELELGHVAVEVLLAAMLVIALHAALEDREEAFDGVCVDRRILGIDVLAAGVVDAAVARESRDT